MKKLLLAAIIAVLSYGTSHSCEYENVYLINLEECEAMGKLIGVEYQCMDETKTGYLLYNRGSKERGYLLTKKDAFFTVMQIEKKDVLGVLER